MPISGSDSFLATICRAEGGSPSWGDPGTEGEGIDEEGAFGAGAGHVDDGADPGGAVGGGGGEGKLLPGFAEVLQRERVAGGVTGFGVYLERLVTVLQNWKRYLLAPTVAFALLLVFFRSTPLDFWGVVLCVAMMSISGLFYIIGGQYLISKLWRLVPISGYSGELDAWKFLILPVLIGVVAGLGASARWYRTIFLEEIGKDYVRTARAKGLSERSVLFGHVLRNALIPILTGVVVLIPSLFLGSLLTESFFGIPGLGSYTIDAIAAQDFAVVRAMVFIGSVLYIVGLVLTDISYTLVDPRVRFEK